MATAGATLFDRLDIVITATLRPALLELTLWAFDRNFFARLEGTRRRIVLNIDPLWGDPADAPRLVDIARRHADDVVVRTPATPGFGEAVRWLWAEAQSEWVFHLEDDWILTRRIDLARLAAETARTDVAQVRFNRRRNHLRRSRRFSLNPNLIRRAFITEALARFDPAKDPEKQILRGHLRPLEKKWRYLEHGRPLAPPVTVDTGREWREMLNITKSVEQLVSTWTPGSGSVDPVALAQHVAEWRRQVEAADTLPPV
jgi:hypothetical protein